MSAANKRQMSKLVLAWIIVVIIANIIAACYYSVSFFGASILKAVWNSSFHIIACLLSIVACIMLLRWKIYGFYLLAIITLFVDGTDFFFIHHSIFVALSGILGIFIWFGILCIKKDGVSVWKNSDIGFDYKHFRHIYQLTSVLIVSVLFGGLYIGFSMKRDDSTLIVEKYPQTADEVWTQLDSPSVTIGQIRKIEKYPILQHMDLEQRQKAEIRMMAMKHILLNCIMIDVHTVRSLKNTYLLHADELSTEQKDVLEWFFRQDVEAQRLWEREKGNASLSEFKLTIIQAMQRNNFDLK